MAKTREQIKKTIAGSLRMERRSHGYTQESLGKAICNDDGTPIASTTVNGWEGGNGAIGLDDAWQMADLYGITLDQLAGRA